MPAVTGPARAGAWNRGAFYGKMRCAVTNRSSKEAYHHGDLRRALLDATLRLVEQRGPQGFTLRAAARAAGVSPGAPYHHFEDKDALLAAVAEEGFELFGAVLREAALEAAPSPRLRAQNVGVAYVRFAIEHPTRFRIMVGYGVQAHVGPGQIASAALGAYQLVRKVLVSGLQGKRAETITEAEVLGWWSIVHGLAFLAIDGHLGKVGKSVRRSEPLVRQVLAAMDKR
ncbi:MAG TPA: TetR/AcrR family transcriptional regulator [Polyangiaceae bacterium]|nr:TetR/AcrR family transcriptional regulator [Polyangiaceae bacterium]